jgi:hypothetical protein
MLMHCLNRKDNAVVLSETLDESAMQTLLELSIANRFPKQCDEWHAAKKNISDFHSREWTKKQQIAFEELATNEHEMRRVLYDAVVGEVIALFPCVLFVISPSHGMLKPQALILGHWNAIASLPPICRHVVIPTRSTVRIRSP